MAILSEIKSKEVFIRFNLTFDSEEISNQMQEEIKLLIQLNKINLRNPVSSRIYLSLIVFRFCGIINLKIGWYALLGWLLGYRI